MRSSRGSRTRLPTALSSRLKRPATWHWASLAGSLVVLLVAASHQWFYFDEWAFLIPSQDAALFEPHVGHWSTSPILITHALRAVFGVTTYWPYMILTIAIHLAICHLLWRLMKRAGVNAWIATALALVLMVLGAGAENILWAFQIGFMGALLIGIIVVLIADHDELTRVQWAWAIGLSILSLTFSGTAIPVLLAAGLVSLARRGVAKTAIMFAPAVVVYLAWYLVFARGKGSTVGASSLGDFGIDVPQYLGHFLIDGLGSVLPFAGLGAIALFCLVVWATLTFTSWRGAGAAAYALAAAAVVQGLLTAVSRLHLGMEAASSSRYVYALVALLLPAIGLAFTWFARQRRSVIAVIVGLTIFVAGYNAVLLAAASQDQSEIEQTSRERIYAALDLITAPGADIDPSTQVDPVLAPDLTAGDLLAMYRAGWITVGEYDDDALDAAKAALGIR